MVITFTAVLMNGCCHTGTPHIHRRAQRTTCTMQPDSPSRACGAGRAAASCKHGPAVTPGCPTGAAVPAAARRLGTSTHAGGTPIVMRPLFCLADARTPFRKKEARANAK
jgi:hypothetical protein